MVKFLFHPEHPLKLTWDLCIFSQTLFLSYWIPFSISFLQDQIPTEMTYFELVITCFFLCDILVTFNTSLYHNGSLLKSRKKIAKIYLKQAFWLDIFSSFPFDWLFDPPLSNKTSSNNFLSIIRMLKFVRIFRLLKLIKSQKIFAKIQDYILNEFISVIYAMLKIAVFLSIVAHWIACIFYFVSISQVDENEVTWVNVAITGKGEEMEINERYVTALYWAFTTMITVGYGDVVPQNNYEMVVTISCMFCSCAYFALIIGNMGSMISSHMSFEQKKSEIRTGINTYLKKNGIPKPIHDKVKAFIENLMNDMSNYKLRDYEVLNLVSHPLRSEILKFLYKNVLKNCQVLSKYFKNIIEQLTKALAIENFSPNDVIFYEKELLRKLYFICSGQVFILHSRTNLIYKRLGKDNFFGEIGFFVGHPRTATARSMDFTLVQSLDLEISKQFINDQTHFTNILEQLSSSCENNHYAALMITCYLCNSLGHVAKDCKSEKLQSGLESVASNYIKRKTRISRDSKTTKAKNLKNQKSRKIFPAKYSKQNSTLLEKIKNFDQDNRSENKVIKKMATIMVIDKILEEDDEEEEDEL